MTVLHGNEPVPKAEATTDMALPALQYFWTVEEPAVPSRSWVLLCGVAGIGLMLLGAAAYLWIVYDDRLPTTMPRPNPEDIGLWAVVRATSAAALAGGSWLLALAWVRARKRRSLVR